MEKNTPSTSSDAVSYQTDGSSFFTDSTEVDTTESPQLESPGGSSISKDGKEDRDLEKAGTDLVPIDIYDPNRPKLGLAQRMNHFTWAWCTWSMSTGGLALLIYAQPHKFAGSEQIGLCIYIINIILFFGITVAMGFRFWLHRGTMKTSVTHSREGFFVPTYFLAIATIITGTQRYLIMPGDTRFLWAISLVFWLYVAATLILAVGQYSWVFAAHKLSLQTMMPTWILPIFPIMLSGTIASVIADTQPEMNAVPIVTAGVTCQGLGISVSFLMYAHMVGRLMSYGLPNREHRPGLFMNVGPPAFTALALIGMANGLPDNFDLNQDGIVDVMTIRTLAAFAAIFLWALSLWWFCIAAISVIISPPKYFHLGWWAMAFPNTGFTLATISIGNELKNEGILWFATGMSICIFLIYFFVLYHLVRAVIVQDIMYPGRDEDVIEDQN
ncbi:voltage-dependent anion channel-domain-containing protein [Xylariomycetidae sp. FL2044]|nr:voltage-dependent anion channel-domain-containing protein [Xylariomycetidae sp. FL2044]